MGSILSAWRSSLLLTVVLVLAGCGAQSHRSAEDGQQDTAAVNEILAYRHSVFQSEDEIIAYVKADTCRWVQHMFGWWYRYSHKSDEHVEYELIAPAIDTCLVIHESLYALDGTLIVDAIREFDTDDSNQPIAYEIMMREMVSDDTLQLLIPWAMAYGKQGSELVPPMTNLRVQLTIERNPYSDVQWTE